jgi:hypothetical protein
MAVPQSAIAALIPVPAGTSKEAVEETVASFVRVAVPGSNEVGLHTVL